MARAGRTTYRATAGSSLSIDKQDTNPCADLQVKALLESTVWSKGTYAMIKAILTAAALSLATAAAAWALPVSQTATLRPLNFSDLIQVGDKNKNKNKNKNNHNRNHNNHHHNHNHGYYHGGRYWGHRYYARPYNWQALGCVVVGPVWYCP
jgi:hypothetical protein